MRARQFADRRFQFFQALLNFRVSDDQRRRQPQHIGARDQRQQTVPHARGDDVARAPAPVRRQRAAEQQPLAADFGERAETPADGGESASQHFPLAAHRLQHFRRADDFQHAVCDRAGDRVAAESAAVRADFKTRGDFRATQHRADGQAAAEPFRRGHDVRRHPEFLVQVERAAAADAGLHFVKNQQRVVAVACLARGAHEIRMRRRHAALALNQFQNHRASRVVRGGFKRAGVVERQVRDAARFRPEVVAVFFLPAGADGEKGAPVKRVVKGDDAVLVRAETPLRVAAREFERGFVGFGAGVGEEHALGESHVAQAARQFNRRRVHQQVADMPEFAGLLGEDAAQFRVGVPERADRDAGREIQIDISVGVPQPRALAALRHDGHRRVGRRHHALV